MSALVSISSFLILAHALSRFQTFLGSVAAWGDREKDGGILCGSFLLMTALHLTAVVCCAPVLLCLPSRSVEFCLLV